MGNYSNGKLVKRKLTAFSLRIISKFAFAGGAMLA